MKNPAALGFAFLGMLILIFTNGLTLSGITVFDESLLETFSWSRSTLKFRDFLNLVCAAIILPFIGAFIDKYGVKRAIVFGLSLLGICYYLYSFIQTPTHMYMLHIGFAFVVGTAGTLSMIIMVSERVKERRGLGIGIAIAGTSLGGMIIPQIGTRLLEDMDWRSAFQYEAILPLLLVVVVLIFLKDIKKGNAEKDEEKVQEEEEAFTFQEAIRTRTFWAICAAGFLSYYSILAIISNLFLYLRSLGFTPGEASNAFTVLFGLMLVAKFLSGFLTDYLSQFTLFKIQFGIMLVGTIGLAIGQTGWVFPFIVIIGLGWGGMYTLFNYIIIDAFGLKSAGKIGGSISTIESIGGGLGMWMTGLLYDSYGSYSVAFWVIAVFIGLSLVLSFLIRPVNVADTAEANLV